jgi:hypothetical protein
LSAACARTCGSGERGDAAAHLAEELSGIRKHLEAPAIEALRLRL